MGVPPARAPCTKCHPRPHTELFSMSSHTDWPVPRNSASVEEVDGPVARDSPGQSMPGLGNSREKRGQSDWGTQKASSAWTAQPVCPPRSSDGPGAAAQSAFSLL